MKLRLSIPISNAIKLHGVLVGVRSVVRELQNHLFEFVVRQPMVHGCVLPGDGVQDANDHRLDMHFRDPLGGDVLNVLDLPFHVCY